MNLNEMPIIWFRGDDKYQPGNLEKVAIDWAGRKIRGTLIRVSNHPNVAKKVQRSVVWFSFDDIGRRIFRAIG